MIFARKMPEFSIKIARKKFPEFWGHVLPLPPVAHAYAPFSDF